MSGAALDSLRGRLIVSVQAEAASPLGSPETIALLARDHIPAIAILTPTNHTLLHEFIDVPEYEKNLAFTHKLLASGGVRVIDLDKAFKAAEFIDNDHLTAAGNQRLAGTLGPVLAQ